VTRDLAIDNHTRLEQARASAPANSAWVSANAGSGKTYVLAQRVVRLLLSGVEPSRILCLTYTNAAAGEMAIRVFDILGSWVAMPDDALRNAITLIEGREPSPGQMHLARILFARALETPGGLKIQTIHAFCEALLHQFPLEANIPGTFSVMDNLMQRQLMTQARRAVVLAAGAGPDSPIGLGFTKMMDSATDLQIDKVLDEIVEHREELAGWLDRIGGPDGADRHARQRLSFSPEETVAGLTEELSTGSVFESLDCETIASLCDATSESRAAELAKQLRGYGAARTTPKKLQCLQTLILTKSGTVRSFKKYPSKAVEEAVPGLRKHMEDEADRWNRLSPRIRTLHQIEITHPLLITAGAMIDNYTTAKRQRGLLDFDDLIERAVELLSRSDARSWVLYKLDLGIDHVLLDEAQDTSPKQWQIISALVEEFYAGQSARAADRTIFAVGDEKQSIYSFRGAEPRNFAEQRRRYVRQAKLAEKPFAKVELGLSFRSTADVLGAVDAVFALPENAAGVTFDAPPPAHTAARHNDPGSVEVWDLVEAQAGDEPENWYTPVDFAGNHQALLLAEKIANQLDRWIDHETIEATGKTVAAGDILVLVRSRDRFIGALTRALKARKIKVAGADRLAITDHIAVQDLVAVGQFTLTPYDDLGLAVVLKCPLIGMDDDQLFALTQDRFQDGREVSLFEALQQSSTPRFVDALEEINRWRDLADRLPAYEFYAHILGALDGRRKILARLGAESDDVVNAFLDAALAHEQDAVPGLQSFLQALSEDNPEIKRELDRTAGEVRIMTIHAAKGLEAPIVFLVDKCSAAFQSQHAPALYRWQEKNAEDCYLWVPASADHGDRTLALREEERRRAEEEYRRLLYVGMTRAEDRLIICGYVGGRKPSTPNWHAMVCKALELDWADIYDEKGELMWHRWKAKDSPPSIHQAKSGNEPIRQNEDLELPPWIGHKLPHETALPRPLNPSGAQAFIDDALTRDPATVSPFGDDSDDGKTPEPRRRGTVLHKLLQILPDMPQEDRSAAAHSFLKKEMSGYPDIVRHAMAESLNNVFDHPQLKNCFNTGSSSSEVPVMGTLMVGDRARVVSGTIDRLAVLDDEILILDYKTGRHAPKDQLSIPDDYIMQMALYRELISRLYPNKPVRCLLVWTHADAGPMIMEVPSSGMATALGQIAQL